MPDAEMYAHQQRVLVPPATRGQPAAFPPEHGNMGKLWSARLCGPMMHPEVVPASDEVRHRIAISP